MKIRVTRNLGTRDGYPPWKAGDEITPKASELELCERLLARGLAERIEEPKKESEPIKAIPTKADLGGVPRQSTTKTQT